MGGKRLETSVACIQEKRGPNYDIMDDNTCLIFSISNTFVRVWFAKELMDDVIY